MNITHQLGIRFSEMLSQKYIYRSYIVLHRIGSNSPEQLRMKQDRVCEGYHMHLVIQQICTVIIVNIPTFIIKLIPELIEIIQK